MSNHPNFDRAQVVLDAVRQGDYGPNFDLYADDIVLENGPGAGPWHRARGKDDLALMLTEFAMSLALIIHAGFAVDCRGGRAALWILILGSGYDKSPADGPGSGVPCVPESPSLVAGTA